jgi:hypothetical protein
MSHRIAAGVGALLWLALIAPSAGAACPAPSPEIAVTLDPPEPAIDNSLPQPALQEMAGKTHHGGRTLGLYRAELSAKWQVRLGGDASGGESCRRVERVAVELALKERVIYIVRARAPGSCGYDSVLAHERKHQAADEALLAEFRPRFAAAAAQATAALYAAAAASPAAGKALEARISAGVDAALRAVFAALGAERRRRQAEIDSPGEYRRVRAACG